MYRVRFHLVLRHFTGKNIKRQSQDNNSFLVLFLVTYRFATTIVFWKMFGGRYSILLLRRYLREKRNIHKISFLAQNLKILPVSTCHTGSRAKALFTLAKPLPDACKHSKKCCVPQISKWNHLMLRESNTHSSKTIWIPDVTIFVTSVIWLFSKFLKKERS